MKEQEQEQEIELIKYNKASWAKSFILGIFVQTIVVFIPALADIFNVTNLTEIQWLITLGISILPIPVMELQKKMNQMMKLHTESY